MAAKSWGNLQKILKAHGVKIDHRGSEAKLIRTNPDGTVDIYCLQHRCRQGKSSTVWAVHVAAIKRKFKIDEL